MPRFLNRMARWLALAAEAVAGLMLAVMFGAFLVTVLFRYVLNWPAGRAAELSSVMWIWLVLFGAAFVVREREEIRFDILYGSVPPAVRRVFMVLMGAGVVGLFLLSLPAVWDYVTFMKVQRTAYLRIRYDWLFSIYVVFAVAVVLRYLWLAGRAIAGHDPLPPEPLHTETTDLRR
jgi:TRAP-type C4-dicarboxylate transport system permease small subunit